MSGQTDMRNPGPEDNPSHDHDAVPTVGARLSANLRDTRSRNLLIALAVVVVVSIIILVSLFSSDETVGVGSQAAPVGGAPPTIIGQGTPTDEVRRAAEEDDRARADAALAQGRSVAARPIGGEPGRSFLDDLPLAPPTPVPDIVEVTPPPATPVPTPNAERAAAEAAYRQQIRLERAAAMKIDMARLTQANQAISGPMITTISRPSSQAAGQQRDATNTDGAPEIRDTNRFEDTVVVIKAGSLEYGLLEDKADTDITAPVFAQIATGPFKGALLRGNFRPDAMMRCIILEFDQLTPIAGESIGVRAMAVDTGAENKPCIVDERNGRYMMRFGSVVALGVLRGAGDAAANSGTSTTVTQGATVATQESSTGRTLGFIAGGIADEAGQIIREIQIRPQIIKNPGGIGIRWLDDVTALRGSGMPN